MLNPPKRYNSATLNRTLPHRHTTLPIVWVPTVRCATLRNVPLLCASYAISWCYPSLRLDGNIRSSHNESCSIALPRPYVGYCDIGC